MKEKNSSRTAEDMAGFRALETLRPKQDRVCEDEFAKHFLTGSWASRYASPIRSKIFLGITHLINPGAINTVSIRVRFIDDYIKTCVKEGIEQIVILGAGYDCRACRMEELKTGVMVFEVDHPATQDQKKRILNGVLGRIPDHLVFVPHHIGEKGFAHTLLEHGYDRDKRSLFIMEGLVMYLAPVTIKKMFSAVSHHACPGSAVVFDFLPPGIEDGSIDNRGGKNMHRWAIKKGEPFQFGIGEKQLPQFLSELGYGDVNVVSAQACGDIYFTKITGKRSLSPLFSFARARVK